MDIQGSELMALQGGSKTLNNVLTIQTEVSFVQQYKKQPLFSEIELFLRKKRFNLTRLMVPHHHPLTPFSSDNPADPAFIPMWTDALFVNSALSPEKLSHEQLLKLAVLAGVRYQMLDVMYRSLKQAFGTTKRETMADEIIQKILS